MSPSRPIEERLDAEVYEIGRAVAALQAMRARLAALRDGTDTPLEQLTDHLATHFQEQCIAACALARICKQQHAASVRTLGDTATDLLGDVTPIARLLELVHGAAPADTREGALAIKLIDAASALRSGHAPMRRSA
jgi:hypothetical protein